MRTTLALSCLAATLSWQPLAAHAATVTYDFSGTISTSDLPTYIPVGTPFSGQFSINASAPDILPGREWQGMYQQGFAFTAVLGGITYSSLIGRVDVFNNWPGASTTFDRYDVVVPNGDLGYSTLFRFNIFPNDAVITLDNATASLFNNDALPSSLN